MTYDGLLDQISNSQILPHLDIIKKKSSKLTVISFEKKNEKSKFNKLRKSLIEKNIIWKNLKFTKKKLYFMKFIDLFKLIFFPVFVSLYNKYDVIHCRGHLPQISGFLLKKLFGVKLIFDCRGFWIEEKLDQNNFNLNSFLNRLIFKIFKNIERRLFKNSDLIILLTQSAKEYVIKNFNIDDKKIYVIPCCSDFNRFRILDDNKKNIMKKKLGLEESSVIIGYVGTLSSLYMVEKMFSFFESAYKKNNNFRFLLISNQNKYLEPFMKDYDFFFKKKICQNIKVDSDSIETIYSIFDISLCFIVPSFARIGTFPIKISESLACGTPVFCQKGIGDIDYLSKNIDGIFVFDFLQKYSMESAVSFISKNQSFNNNLIREKAKKYLSSSFASKKYNLVYDNLKFN